MNIYTPPVQELIDQFSRLPGIGAKSAQRIAFYILQAAPEEAERLTSAIQTAKREVKFCARCCNFSADDICELCHDQSRDATAICVVEESRDIAVVERSGEFKGLYHVLHGAMNPIEGIGPDQLKVKELLDRLGGGQQVKEVIVATSPNIEGEATALYLARLLNPLGIIVTRPASGMPVGGDLEFVDELTLGRALTARQRLTDGATDADVPPADF